MERQSLKPMLVVVSCGLCFIQTCTTFTVLLPILYKQKCTITFMKMQFCTSNATAMALLILGFLKQLPADWNWLFGSTFGAVLLLGTSTLIGLVLIIQSDVANHRTVYKTASAGSSSSASAASTTSISSNSSASLASAVSNGLKSAIGLSWLLPILYAIGIPLTYNITRLWPHNWWLEYGTAGFNLFVITEFLLGAIYCFLYFMLVKKFWLLSKKYDKHKSFIMRR